MADEVLSDLTDVVIDKGEEKAIIVEMRANGSDIKPGHAVTGVGETYPDIDLVAAGEGTLGVALEHLGDDGLDTYDPQKNIDEAYTDNALVRVCLLGSGVVVWMFWLGQTGPIAAEPGLRVVGDAGAIKAPVFTATPTVQELEAAFESFVGMIVDYDAGHATELRVVRAMI